jgi:flagellin FlaB
MRLKDRKGEMGIGTMIIFIAMVLVAAVAAAVLVSTAYLVQQQAQDTGEKAIDDVATGLKIECIYGDRSGGPGGTLQPRICNLTIKVRLEAGSPAINLSDVTVQISDGSKHYTLNYTWGRPTSSRYAAKKIRDPKGTFTARGPVISAGGLVKLYLNTDDSQSPGWTGMDLDLDPQQTAWIRIIPKHGVPTYERFRCPSTFITQIVEL